MSRVTNSKYETMLVDGPIVAAGIMKSVVCSRLFSDDM